MVGCYSPTKPHFLPRSKATKQSTLCPRARGGQRIASLSLSTGAHSRDPLARNDGLVWFSPPIEHKTGDDEHCRHRQRLRERFRGRPFGGFLHAVLPRPGHDSSPRESACDGQIFFTRNTPRRVFALIESPLSEYRPCQGRTVMRRHFDSRVTRSA